MSNLKEKLEAEVEWRNEELNTIEALFNSQSLSEKQKKLLIKNAIPIAYATWEGFVKTAFRIYSAYINDLNLNKNDIHTKILTHSIDTKFEQITTGIQKFDKKVKFIEELITFIDQNIMIETKLPTENNVNLKVINQILDRFNLELLPENPFKGQLNKLLIFRNSVAHGESSIPIRVDDVVEQINNVNNLMDEVMLKILEGFNSETYLKNE